MSNFLAVATVSAVLQRLLAPVARAAVTGAEVWIDRPDARPQKEGVNIYLYRHSLDAVSRNADLPARRADGTLTNRPKVATSLHYLVTFHGKDDLMVPQRLLGATLAALHTRPVITRALIQAVNDEATAPSGMHGFLALNDLLDAEDLVRVSPDPMSLDELSKLWSVFFQSPYQLSATYVASAVLLEETLETPLPAPPVTRPQLTVRGLLRPTILGARNASDPRAPLVTGSRLRIDGRGLDGDQVLVRVGSLELVPEPDRITASSVEVDVSGPSLRAGLQPVTVAHRWLVGDPAQPRGGETSNTVGVLVAPTITVDSTSGAVTVTSDLPVGTGQRVSVTLLHRTSGESARVVHVPERTVESTTVTVPAPTATPELPAGEYGVVLTVDGAPSPVTRDADGTVTAPLVTVT